MHGSLEAQLTVGVDERPDDGSRALHYLRRGTRDERLGAGVTPELEQLAEMLYAQRVQERGPAWSQLGDVTRSVWLERALFDVPTLEELFG